MCFLIPMSYLFIQWCLGFMMFLWPYFFVLLQDKLLIFFHGFLGTGEDWVPIMKAVSSTSRCISIDLPGHGQSSFGEHVDGTCNQEQNMSIEMVSAVLCKLISRYMPKKIILVGYSMGARIALYMALKGSIQVDNPWLKVVWIFSLLF